MVEVDERIVGYTCWNCHEERVNTYDVHPLGGDEMQAYLRDRDLVEHGELVCPLCQAIKTEAEPDVEEAEYGADHIMRVEVCVRELNLELGVKLSCTCHLFPLQIEGELPNGEYLYYRSRHDEWRVGISATKDGAVLGTGFSREGDGGDIPEEAYKHIREAILEHGTLIMGSDGGSAGHPPAPPAPPEKKRKK